jgi:glycine/D-amino acid oxidase-like deaminating enzyme
MLELEWPSIIPPLPLPLNSQAYVVMKEGGKSCICGATYEKEFKTLSPDLELARNEILPKVASMLPVLSDAKVINCKTGLRASTPNHLPLIGHVSDRICYITGMGSKGFLYHALMARALSQNIFK